MSHYEDRETRDVREFHRKFQLVVGDDGPRLLTHEEICDRYDFLYEELTEFQIAAQRGDLADMADALIDIVYVAKGTAIMMGLPWEQLWNDVQRANMAKVQDHSKCGDAHKAGMVKPEGWVAPTGSHILAMHGYVEEN